MNRSQLDEALMRPRATAPTTRHYVRPSKGLSDWQFTRRLLLSLAVFWLLWLPLGLWSPVPVIAATIVVAITGTAWTALMLIWRTDMR